MSKLSTPEHTGYTMPLSVEQIIHQSDADTPLKTWVSPKMPKAIQQAFMLTIANPYLREAALAGSLLKAAYLRQLSADELLFGWVYTDESQSGQGKFTSTFICYFFNQPLEAPELELIFECLEAGPVVSSQGLKDEDAIDPLTIRDSTYTPARSGIPIPSNVTALNRLLLYKKKLLHCFIPYEEQPIPSKAKLAGMQHSALPSESIATTNFPLESLTLNLNNKGALLVGTSEHQLGVQPLPGVKKDIASLQKVLVDPKKGNFAVVDVLLNSDSPAMAAKIEDFFSNRASESLALLYFSGYAVLDRQGTLYLSTAESRRNTQGKIIRSTFISSDFLGAVLRDSPAQQRVIILDICMSRESSPILGGSHKLLETARQHLSGPGLTLLISSAAFHDTNVQKGVQPSIYTYYLVEGLETGIADSNGTGIITLSKWHTYAKQKVQIASPALRPVFYGPLDQKQLPIARVPINDARLQYRREVERLSRSGQISLVHQLILDNLQKKLNLNASDCAEVKAEVLKPYNDYRYKLKRYALTYLSRVNQSGKEQYSSTPQIDYLQNLLGLTDVDTEPIKSEIFQQLHTIPMPEIAETTSTSSALGYKGRIP
ncbi:MAG TPA: caspase family protein, partial [Stenomitos sp.]